MAVWLITGATGFVGRQVLGALHDRPTGLRIATTRWSCSGRRCPAGLARRRFAAVDLR